MKKFIFLLSVILFLLFFIGFALAKCPASGCPKGFKCIDNECVRQLELVYPQIGGGGKPVPKTVAFGLPKYIKYIFNLAVAFIGLIIFGALVYNGALYLTSAGSPQKMKDARDGIISAFFGGVLLLSSVLIFNTINPQLTIMELPKVNPLEQTILSGIYICNYNVQKEYPNFNLKQIIRDYALEGRSGRLTKSEIDRQKKAAEKLKKIIWNPDKKKKRCLKVNFSGDLQNLTLHKQETIFAVPSIKVETSGLKRKIEYNYGLVLHEKENYSGRCYLLNQDKGDLYSQIDGFSTQNANFDARSITLFQKPSSEPQGDGVTLYECFNYNKQGQCKEKHETPLSYSFKPGKKDFAKTKDLKGLEENARSIAFSSKSYFALLFKGDNFNDRCQLIAGNRPDLADLPLGCCNKKKIKKRRFRFDKICYPCINSMIVVKGNRL